MPVTTQPRRPVGRHRRRQPPRARDRPADRRNLADRDQIVGRVRTPISIVVGHVQARYAQPVRAFIQVLFGVRDQRPGRGPDGAVGGLRVGVVQRGDLRHDDDRRVSR